MSENAASLQLAWCYIVSLLWNTVWDTNVPQTVALLFIHKIGRGVSAHLLWPMKSFNLRFNIPEATVYILWPLW